MADIFIATAIIMGILPFFFLLLMSLFNDKQQETKFFFMILAMLSVIGGLEFTRNALDVGEEIAIGFNETVYPALNLTASTTIFKTNSYSGLADVVFAFEFVLGLLVFIAIVMILAKIVGKALDIIKGSKIKI